MHGVECHHLSRLKQLSHPVTNAGQSLNGRAAALVKCGHGLLGQLHNVRRKQGQRQPPELAVRPAVLQRGQRARLAARGAGEFNRISVELMPN